MRRLAELALTAPGDWDIVGRDRTDPDRPSRAPAPGMAMPSGSGGRDATLAGQEDDGSPRGPVPFLSPRPNHSIDLDAPRAATDGAHDARPRHRRSR